MIIAELIDHSGDEHPSLGRVYLSTAPFPGDTVRTDRGVFLVVRRSFLDLGPDSANDPERLSIELRVRLDQ